MIMIPEGKNLIFNYLGMVPQIIGKKGKKINEIK